MHAKINLNDNVFVPKVERISDVCFLGDSIAYIHFPDDLFVGGFANVNIRINNGQLDSQTE